MSSPYSLEEGSLDIEPDIDAYDERLWELYVESCHQTHTAPTIKGYLIWLEENYD